MTPLGTNMWFFWPASQTGSTGDVVSWFRPLLEGMPVLPLPRASLGAVLCAVRDLLQAEPYPLIGAVESTHEVLGSRPWIF